MAANIELIKVLRDRTGAGIMDCKNALVACENDVEKACDWLREKGIAKQAKKASRTAAEGLIGIHHCEKCKRTSIVEVNCETDFVANADPFKNLVEECSKIVLKNNLTTIEEAVAATESLFAEATVKLGEKLTFRRFETFGLEEGQGFGTYIHNGGKIGVVVILEKDNAELAKGIAMTIAANNPKFNHMSDIPAEVIENEKKIQLEAAKNDERLKNKPAAALPKIIEGKVNKFFSESVLDDQEYILNPELTVANALKQANNSVIKFVRFQAGEGIEKRVDNFAEEVAKQVGNN